MVYKFNNKSVFPYKKFNIFLSIFTLIVFVPFSSADAIGITKASALISEEIRAASSLSFKKNPPITQADPCLSFLNAPRPSLGVSAVSNFRRPVGKTVVPVSLGLVIGIRIALGSKKVVKASKRVKIGPEIRTGRTASGNYALAIAAYRSCKNEHSLGLLKNKNNKKQARK